MIDKKKEYMKEYMREYCKNNKDKLKEYYQNNKEYSKERTRKYRKENKDRIKEYMKEYNKKYNKSLALYDTYINRTSYAELTRHDPRNEELLQVKCTYCGKWFNPTNLSVSHRIAGLEGKTRGENRLYCSKECKHLCPIYKKVKYSAEETNTKQLSREVQPELRQMVFERDEWTCIKCGETVGLQCHHIDGILWNPIESADIDICVTFCVKCHKEAHKDEGCRYVDLQCRKIDNT